MNTATFIGTMSGTSVDGLDIVVADFDKNGTPNLIHSYFAAYPSRLRRRISHLQTLPASTLFNLQHQELSDLDQALADFYSEHIRLCLTKNDIASADIQAIGNHGQTILHQPNSQPAFSLQICDPQQLANLCQIPVIANFRQADIQQQGQGAPLIPAFHAHIFNTNKPCAIINIGGISNSTFLFEKEVTGFDHGPGNTLMDAWIFQNQQKAYDKDGAWAKSGTVHEGLLQQLLDHPYFQLKAPKSTGQDMFNLSWLESNLLDFPDLFANDIQATLCDLTAKCIAQDILNYKPAIDRLYVCGGGVQNHFLMERLAFYLDNKISISSTQKLGIDPNWVEALGFAWLAFRHTNEQTGNLPAVTGAKKAVILGQRYDPKP